jgi:hypothetical protein
MLVLQAEDQRDKYPILAMPVSLAPLVSSSFLPQRPPWYSVDHQSKQITLAAAVRHVCYGVQKGIYVT